MAKNDKAVQTERCDIWYSPISADFAQFSHETMQQKQYKCLNCESPAQPCLLTSKRKCNHLKMKRKKKVRGKKTRGKCRIACKRCQCI